MLRCFLPCVVLAVLIFSAECRVEAQKVELWRIQGKITDISEKSLTITRRNKKTMKISFNAVTPTTTDGKQSSAADVKKGLYAAVILDYDAKRAERIYLYIDLDMPIMAEGPLK